MFASKKDGSTKCINAWVGLMIIAAVCVIIALAVFVEFKTPIGQKRNTGQSGYAQAAFNNPEPWNSNLASQQSENSVIF